MYVIITMKEFKGWTIPRLFLAYCEPFSRKYLGIYLRTFEGIQRYFGFV